MSSEAIAKHKPTSSTATSSTSASTPIYSNEMEKKRISVASALYTDETGPAVGTPDGNRDLEKATGEEVPALSRNNSPGEEEIDDGRPTMVGKRLAVLVAGILSACVILALDQAIIAPALPILSSHFHALDQMPWVVNSFFLTQATGTLTSGQLYTFLPAKQTFLCSILIFEIGSLLSAIAPVLWLLLLGRAITGLGAGFLVVGTHTIISQVVRLQDRSMYYSSLGAVFTVSSIGGPLLGGVFTDKLSWRWCFYINLPVGAVGALAVIFVLPAYPVRLPPSLKSKTALGRWATIDWLGNILALGMTVTLVMALQWGGITYEWSDPRIIVLFILFGITTILFFGWELYLGRRGGHAMVPLKLFNNRSVSGAALHGLLLNVILGVISTYLPLLYQARGSSALQSGILFLPFMGSTVFFLLISGILVKKIGYYKPWMTVGPWVACIAAGCLTNTNLMSKPMLIGWQILLGAGFGVAFQNTIMCVQAEFASQNRLIPQAASIVGFAQRMGPLVGISISGSIFFNALDKSLETLPFPLDDAQQDSIRESLRSIWNMGLTQEQISIISDIFVKAIAQGYIVMVPTSILAGLAALIVKNHNVRKRGS